MWSTSPTAPGHRLSDLASFVLATLTVLGLVTMHAISWGHDSGCHAAPSASSSMYAPSHDGLAVKDDEHASMLGMVPPLTVDRQQAATPTAAADLDSSMTKSTDHLHVGLGEPRSFVTARAPVMPVPGSDGFSLMCVAVLAGLAVLALLLAASRRAGACSTSRVPTTRASGVARRWTPPWPHLAPRLSVLCVSRT